MEQGQTHRAETAAKAPRHLGDPDEASDDLERPRACDVQSRNRQQASSVRSHAMAGAGRPSRKPRGCEGHRHAAEAPAAGPIRDHGADPGWPRSLDRSARTEGGGFSVSGRLHTSPHLSAWQYARMVHRWVASIGFDYAAYGTHTMRRTKASLIYRRTKNLRAVRLPLAHTQLESTVRYLGIEVDDALEMAEQTEV